MGCFEQVTNKVLTKVSICFLTTLFVLTIVVEKSTAAGKLDASLRTQESMQEHTSDEPRRLMHDVLYQEFCKGDLIQIVNPENSSYPVKHRPAHYHIGANLIAFSFAPKSPIHVSLAIQLVDDASKRVIMQADRALYVDEKVVESGLKLHKTEFDNSQYGKAITALSRMAAKLFEQRVQGLNLSITERSSVQKKESHIQDQKGRRIASPF
jgi:hypothetical protein